MIMRCFYSRISVSGSLILSICSLLPPCSPPSRPPLDKASPIYFTPVYVPLNGLRNHTLGAPGAPWGPGSQEARSQGPRVPVSLGSQEARSQGPWGPKRPGPRVPGVPRGPVPGSQGPSVPGSQSPWGPKRPGPRAPGSHGVPWGPILGLPEKNLRFRNPRIC